MQALLGIVALVLVAGGGAKLRDPGPTRDLLAALGLPARFVRRRSGRFVGAVEVGVGLAAIVVGGTVAAALVAAAYLVVGVAAWRILRTAGPSVSCGCFGAASAPPSGLHVGIDFVCAAGAAAAAVAAPPGLLQTVMSGGAGTITAAAVVTACGVVVAAWLVVACLTVLPATLAAARDVRSAEGAARTPTSGAGTGVRSFALTPRPADATVRPGVR